MRALVVALTLLASLARPAGAEELMVAAAVSLREPMEAIASRFESTHPGTKVQLVFGASSALAAQAMAGAPLDIFVSADEETIDKLGKAGLVSARSRRVIAGNQLVVIVAADFKMPITSAADLKRPEVRRIALPERAVPLGHYAREWLAAQGLLEALAPRLVITEHARATLAVVDAGNAEAGIVYATDARVATSARVAFTPPAAQQPRIVYVAAQVAKAPWPALAEKFLLALTEADAQATLAAAGFTPPPGPAPH
jgi:molybdate transport system substrate-binding protein